MLRPSNQNVQIPVNSDINMMKPLVSIDFGAQNGSNITPGGLSETAGAPRSSEEQQTATKSRTMNPRAASERPKSVPKRRKRRTGNPGGGSARLEPDCRGGVGEG